jgi:hypothetical protein
LRRFQNFGSALGSPDNPGSCSGPSGAPHRHQPRAAARFACALPTTQASGYAYRRTISQLTSNGEPLTTSLAPIPVVDVRKGGALRHAQEHSERAHALRDTIIASHPPFIRPLVPMLDGIARRWLLRSQSPYVDEVSAIADLLGHPGIWFLNSSYQWCCTALAREEDGRMYWPKQSPPSILPPGRGTWEPPAVVRIP